MSESLSGKTVYHGKGWSLFLPKKSTNLYVLASEKGRRRLYETTGTGNITEGMRIGREKYQYWQRATAVPLGRKLIGDGWKNLSSLREKEIKVGDLKATTHKSTQNAWERLEFFWDGKLPTEITQDNWIAYKALMNERFRRPSLQPEFKCLNLIANFMHRSGDAPFPPSIEIGKGNAKPLEPRRYIPADHLNKIWTIALKRDERVALFVGNGMRHGMRIEEVVSLEQKNLKQVDGIWFLHIAKSKTGPRTIKISDPLVPLFKQIRAIAPHKFFFPRVRGDKTGCSATQVWDRQWRGIREAAGFDYVFHELRHTAISNAIAANVNPGKVSRYFGVSLQEIDRTYLKLTEGQTSECADVLRF